MIKDPPLLTIKRRFARPPTTLVEAFRGVPTGHLVDAMGGRGVTTKAATASRATKSLLTRSIGTAARGTR